jgi:prepilin-type N-terminal cleavage/methylation domain-containing protein
MEPFRDHRSFTTKQVRQKRNSYFSFANERKEQPRSSGFTLVEMMIVLVIISIITGVALTSQGNFNKTLVLANTAYDIALTMRSAQTFGLSTRGSATSTKAGYGLRFQRNVTNSFTLYADTYPSPGPNLCHPLPQSGTNSPNALPGNCSYDSTRSELLTTYTLGNGITIPKFCTLSANNWECTSGTVTTISALDIVFERPNPDAFMSENGAYNLSFPVTRACITLRAPQTPAGEERHIQIQRSGQIIANATSCP